MKVLHISTSSSGGAAQAANRLHLGLLHAGFDSNILYLEKYNNIKNSHEFVREEPNLFLKTFKKLKLYRTQSEKNEEEIYGAAINTMFSFAESNYDITRHKLYNQADIINLHWVSEFIDFPSFFRNNNKKIVWTLHDQNPFTGGCHYSGICHKYTSNCNNCFLWKENKSLIAATEKNLLLKKNALNKKKLTIVTPSKWLFNLSSHSTLFGKYKHYHIPYGLDTNLFCPVNKSQARKKFNIPDDKKVILFISDKLFEERKGFRILKEALSILNRDDIHCLAVGQRNDFDSSKNIQYTNRIDDEKTIISAYNAADVFILPSLQDNLPNTILEAFSCGIPAIGFPVGGISEYLKNGENGILTKGILPHNLANAITNFFSSKHHFNSELIRNFAVKHFESSIQAKAYIDLYSQL